jgi:uncharacterized membrane protein
LNNKKEGGAMRMPILVLHICGGLVGLLSGAMAMFFRKGSRWHGIAGSVFVVSMLTMASAGVTLAVMKSQPGNIVGGTLTFYLVATAWMTAKRRAPETGLLDWGALLLILALAAVEMTWGVEAATSPTGLKYDYPPVPYFFMGSVAVLAAVGDVRMLVRRGIAGSHRLARHLWRMCFALFIASASLFLARQHLFPVFMRKTGSLVLLSFLPLVLMIFWLLRVRFAKAYKSTRQAIEPMKIAGQRSPHAA